MKSFAAVKRPEDSEMLAVLEEIESEGKNNANTQAEAVKLAGTLKSALTSKSANEDLALLNQKEQQFRTSQLSPQAFALELKQIAVRQKIRLSIPEDLRAGVQNQRTMKQLEGTKFFQSLDAYAEAVKNSLMTSDAQRDLNAKTRRLSLLKKLVKLELTQDEWKEVKESGSREFSSAEEGEVFKGSAAQLSFYQTAEKRDGAFLSKLQQIWKENPSAKASIMVSGGFHAQGLVRHLTEQGYSVILVMPAIPQIPAETNYRDHMRGNVSWKNYFEVEEGKINLYKAFVRGTRDKLLKRQDAEGIDPRLLKEWRDQIIRDLAEQNKIENAGDYTRFLDEVAGNSKKEKLNTWMEKIDNFVKGLRKLDSEKQLNEQSIYNLMTATQGTLIMGSTDVTTSLPSQDLLVVEAARPEIRSILSDDRNYKDLFGSSVLMNELEALGPDEDIRGIDVNNTRDTSIQELEMVSRQNRRDAIRRQLAGLEDYAAERLGEGRPEIRAVGKDQLVVGQAMVWMHLVNVTAKAIKSRWVDADGHVSVEFGQMKGEQRDPRLIQGEAAKAIVEEKFGGLAVFGEDFAKGAIEKDVAALAVDLSTQNQMLNAAVAQYYLVRSPQPKSNREDLVDMIKALEAIINYLKDPSPANEKAAKEAVKNFTGYDDAKDYLDQFFARRVDDLFGKESIAADVFQPRKVDFTRAFDFGAKLDFGTLAARKEFDFAQFAQPKLEFKMPEGGFFKQALKALAIDAGSELGRLREALAARYAGQNRVTTAEIVAWIKENAETVNSFHGIAGRVVQAVVTYSETTSKIFDNTKPREADGLYPVRPEVASDILALASASIGLTGVIFVFESAEKIARESGVPLGFAGEADLLARARAYQKKITAAMRQAQIQVPQLLVPGEVAPFKAPRSEMRPVAQGKEWGYLIQVAALGLQKRWSDSGDFLQIGRMQNGQQNPALSQGASALETLNDTFGKIDLFNKDFMKQDYADDAAALASDLRLTMQRLNNFLASEVDGFYLIRSNTPRSNREDVVALIKALAAVIEYLKDPVEATRKAASEAVIPVAGHDNLKDYLDSYFAGRVDTLFGKESIAADVFQPRKVDFTRAFDFGAKLDFGTLAARKEFDFAQFAQPKLEFKMPEGGFFKQALKALAIDAGSELGRLREALAARYAGQNRVTTAEIVAWIKENAETVNSFHGIAGRVVQAVVTYSETTSEIFDNTKPREADGLYPVRPEVASDILALASASIGLTGVIFVFESAEKIARESGVPLGFAGEADLLARAKAYQKKITAAMRQVPKVAGEFKTTPLISPEKLDLIFKSVTDSSTPRPEIRTAAGYTNEEIQNTGIDQLANRLEELAISRVDETPQSLIDKNKVRGAIAGWGDVLRNLQNQGVVALDIQADITDAELRDYEQAILAAKGNLTQVIIAGDISRLNVKAFREAGINFTTVNKLGNVRQSQLTGQNSLPAVLSGHEKFANELIFEIDHDNTNDPVLAIGAAFLQVTIAALIAAENIKDAKELQSRKADLLKQLFGEYAGRDDVFTVNADGSITIKTEAMRLYIEFKATQAAGKAA